MPTFKGRDKVFLLRKNIKIKRPSAKLDHVKIGPFRVIKRIGKVNYRLELPKTIRIYSVFYIVLLERVPDGA